MAVDVLYRATELGFYAGSLKRAGEVFSAPTGEQFSWAVRVETATDAPAKQADTPFAELLGAPVAEVLRGLASLPESDLPKVRDAEANGQKRKSLLRAIDDEIANRPNGVDPLS